MMRLMWLLIVCFTFPSFAIAEDKSAEERADYPSIAGTYVGSVFNGDDMDPVLTTFFLDGSGQIAGKYAIGEEAALEVGELSNFRTEGNYTFVADWKDRYGTGVLRVLFSSNYRVFYGLWGASESDTSMPWNGVAH